VALAWPFSHAAARLAELMTRTLREVYGADPRRLRYRAAYGVSDEDWDARAGWASRSGSRAERTGAGSPERVKFS
jgi:hypothetical protein